MKKIVLSLSMISFIVVSCLSQLSYEKRIEFDLKDGYYGEEIDEFGENGLILSAKAKNPATKGTEIKYELFSNNLSKVKEKSISLIKGFRHQESYRNDDYLFSLYKKKDEFTLISVNSDNLEIKQAKGLLPKKTYIQDMVVVGDLAFLSVITKKTEYIITINWKTSETKVDPIILPAAGGKGKFRMSIQAIDEVNEVFVFVKSLLKGRETDLYVMKYNSKGSKDFTVNITAGIDKNVIDISVDKVSGNNYVFTGTYGDKTFHSSNGLFVCKVSNNKVSFFKHYNYLNIKNFLSYLSEKTIKKIEKKKEKKESKGKELSINYLIAPHDIMQVDDGYIFIGEAYYATYRTETYTTTDANGNTVTKYKQVFDGYQYTHAVIVKYTNDGKIAWSETFDLTVGYKPMYVKKFISVTEQDESSLKMVYSSLYRIHSKTISYNGTVLKDKKSEEIKTSHEGDNVRASYSNVSHWYEDNFVAYGSQVIKNKDLIDGKKKRKVYFINKIRYK